MRVYFGNTATHGGVEPSPGLAPRRLTADLVLAGLSYSVRGVSRRRSPKLTHHGSQSARSEDDVQAKRVQLNLINIFRLKTYGNRGA